MTKNEMARTPPAMSSDPLFQYLYAMQKSEVRAKRKYAKRVMWGMLKRDGFDRVEVEYDGAASRWDTVRMTYYRGGAEVPAEAVPYDVAFIMPHYVMATLPRAWADDRGGKGNIRLYPASEYACFRYAKRRPRYEVFTDGEAGPEVPARDRW